MTEQTFILFYNMAAMVIGHTALMVALLCLLLAGAALLIEGLSSGWNILFKRGK